MARVILYAVLAIALIVTLYFHPRVREEYYYWQWQYAKDSEGKETYFNELLEITTVRARREEYVERRARELLVDPSE